HGWTASGDLLELSFLPDGGLVGRDAEGLVTWDAVGAPRWARAMPDLLATTVARDGSLLGFFRDASVREIDGATGVDRAVRFSAASSHYGPIYPRLVTASDPSRVALSVGFQGFGIWDGSRRAW